MVHCSVTAESEKVAVDFSLGRIGVPRQAYPDGLPGSFPVNRLVARVPLSMVGARPVDGGCPAGRRRERLKAPRWDGGTGQDYEE
ncbi:hypothetical protein GCM10010307_75160 [Streptomyces vastus]|uniref:Uncharacterized protein n=1 Tax=Streptomyces vastus TaxID=285451 RepID=A0ABP6E3B5_9ACTN